MTQIPPGITPFRRSSRKPGLTRHRLVVVSIALLSLTIISPDAASAEIVAEDPARASASRDVALAGTYLVGAGQPIPFNSLTNAVNEINAVGVRPR